MKAEDVVRLLPWVFQRTYHPGNPLSVLIDVIEGLQEPSEEILTSVDTYFNPYRAPDCFVPYLASWMDLDRLLESGPGYAGHAFAPGSGHLRELVATNAMLSSWRGTNLGLVRFLETATGIQGFAIEENLTGSDNTPLPFHIRVVVTDEARRFESLLVRIVEAEKPAYVTYELVMREEQSGTDRQPGEEAPDTGPDPLATHPLPERSNQDERDDQSSP